MIRIELRAALNRPAFAMRDGVLWRENLLVFHATAALRAVTQAFDLPRTWWRDWRRKCRMRRRELQRLERALAATQSQLALQKHGLVVGANTESYVLQWRRTLERYSSIVVDREIFAMARWLIIHCSKDSAAAVTLAARHHIANHQAREHREAMEIVKRKIIGNLEPRLLEFRIF